MKKRDKKIREEKEQEEKKAMEDVKVTTETKDEKEPKLKTLDEKYQDALKEIDDLKKKRMYLQAEMQNSQKIAMKRIENNKFSIKVDVIKNFLPLVDSFDAAVSKYESTSKQDYNQLLEGVKSLQKQFLQVLTGLGIKPIEKIHVPFNYKEHEVFMKLVDEKQPEDTVIKIAQKGYYLGENVLRPAKVIVSKKKDVPKAIPVEAEIVESIETPSEQSNESTTETAPPIDSEKPKTEDNPKSDYIS